MGAPDEDELLELLELEALALEVRPPDDDDDDDDDEDAADEEPEPDASSGPEHATTARPANTAVTQPKPRRM